jgi:hypothetical protein
MIISDSHKFVFVHIPKCAGTSVRSYISRYDDRDGAYSNRVENHRKIGPLDYVHIPLFILEEYFPQELEHIRSYHSFTVIRDPYDRFASSVAQRFRMYHDEPIQKQTVPAIRKEIERVMNYLRGQQKNKAHLLPPEYIHFQRQSDYIYLREERLIERIYRLDEVAGLLEDVGQIVGQTLTKEEEKQPAQANITRVHRSDGLRRVVEGTRPLLRPLLSLLPESAKKKMRQWVYVPGKDRLGKLFDEPAVTSFIEDYYAADVKLWQESGQPVKKVA